MLLSERLLTPVPAGTPATAAALTEPMAVGLHAVNMANLSGSEACLVVGCGPVGLAVITALRARGVAPVVASDFSAGRRALAATLGADNVVDPATDDPFAEPDLKNADALVVFECVGVPGMIDQIFLNCPPRTRIVVVGVCLQTDHSRPLIAINKELNVQYVLGYSNEEFVDSLRAIADGRFQIDPFISHRVPLEGVGSFRRPGSVGPCTPDAHGKVLVEPWQ